MRLVIQRVSEASVSVDQKVVGQVGCGLLLLLGIESEDGEEDIDWLCRKVLNMRIFSDDHKGMNLSIQDVKGDLLLVSQFTLHASTKKGNRPSFVKAAKPEIAIPMYEQFKSRLEKELGRSIAAGIFGADMKVSLLNDGPVTIILDSKNKE